MRLLLTSRYALRGWTNLPYVLIDMDGGDNRALTMEECAFLERCDGVGDVCLNNMARRFLGEGVICPAPPGAVIAAESRFRDYGAPYFSCVSLSPTARCNFNCRHCFMARDAAPSNARLTKEQCCSIMRQLRDMGVGEIRFTGGEPLIHPDLGEILITAKALGFRVREILTNGSLITREFLEMMRGNGLNPLMMISFDGLGWHDWMRGTAGAEKMALEAINLCVEAGFPVCADICAHRRNTPVLRRTAERLSDMGVEAMRVIRVSESPRWIKTSSDSLLSPEEYFSFAEGFIDWYMDSDLRPMLEMWSIMRYFPDTREVRWMPEPCANGDKLKRRYVCASMRNTLQISADGNMYPCNIVSGAMRARGIEPKNALSAPLREILSDESWMKSQYPKMSDYFARNPECAECAYRGYCQGGCRAIGYAMTGDALGRDEVRCAYWKLGFAERIRKTVGEKLQRYERGGKGN